MPIFIVALGLVLGAVAVNGWLIAHLSAQSARINVRLEAMADRLLAARGHAAQPAASALDLLLAASHGAPTSLRALLAAGKPLFLLFTDPRCGPCYELLPELGSWQRAAGDRLTFALVSSGGLEVNRASAAEYGLAHVVVQHEHSLNDALGIRQLPAALIVGVDGQLAGETVYGAYAVRSLAAELTGVAPQAKASPRTEPIHRGELAPALTRPDLDGRPIAFGGPRAEATMLLFWSPGCSHCAELAPAIAAWERQPGAGLVIVSRGPAMLNREAGFRSPLVLDDDRALAAAFGIGGTPSAVMIDRHGRVASDVQRGGANVRALAGAVWPSAAAAVGTPEREAVAMR